LLVFSQNKHEKMTSCQSKETWQGRHN
jgi:hypothetical protein